MLLVAVLKSLAKWLGQSWPTYAFKLAFLERNLRYTCLECNFYLKPRFSGAGGWWWVRFTERPGYPPQDMLLAGRSHSMMCAPPVQMCPYCFQSEFQAFGADTELDVLTCVPVEANKESSLHFLKCSVPFTSPETQQEKFTSGRAWGGFSLPFQNRILVLQPLFLVSKWELLAAKLFQVPLCSGDTERQQWKGNT